MFTYGNVGRVRPDFRNPGLRQPDSGLQKFFRLGERLRLQLRGELFNLTIRVNLGAPDTGFHAMAFGSINSVGAPGALQFGAKLTL